MKISFPLLVMAILLVLLTTAQAFGISRVVVGKDMALENLFTANNTKYIIKSNINLRGKTLVVGPGSSLIFKRGQLNNGEVVLSDNNSVKNGLFVDVTLTICSNSIIKNCVFLNRNRNICISANSIDAKSNITIDRCSFLNSGNDIKDKGSIHCIYLNSVSGVKIRNCRFNNIGNVYTDKVSGISINTINQEKGKDLVLERLSITNNKFNGLLSKDNINNKHSGEYHFIIVCSSQKVTIKGNTLDNNYESIGYGKEPIYLKCNDVIVEKNKIEGYYGGEATICIKNYTKENISSAPKVDVLNNVIKGKFFSAVYHTGSGTIRGNTFINTQAYALSCENDISETHHSFVIENNYIELGTEVPELMTGTSRAAITFLSLENKPIKAILRNNHIQIRSQIEVIRCRFSYDIDLELDNNIIISSGKIVSFANLSGYEKSFKLKARRNNNLNTSLIAQPYSSKFEIFEIRSE